MKALMPILSLAGALSLASCGTPNASGNASSQLHSPAPSVLETASSQAPTASAGASSQAPSASEGASSQAPWTLFHQDDFSDPARGLFLSEQGELGSKIKNGGLLRSNAQTRYGERALLLSIKGNYAATAWPYVDRVCHVAAAADKVFGDLAIEAQGLSSSSPEQTSWGISTGGYSFSILPGGRYSLARLSDMLPRSSSALHFGPGQDNQLRIELVKDVLTAYANGQQIDRVQDSRMAVRPAGISLQVCMTGQPASGASEATFTNFKVYSRPSPASSAAAVWSPFAADDFSDPARGLFSAESGNVRADSGQASSTSSIQYRSRYSDHALVLTAGGPSYNVANARTGPCVPTFATSKLSGDFAVEAHGRATVSPEQAGWGIRWSAVPHSVYGVEILPNRWYSVHRVLGGLTDSGMDLEYVEQGRSTALRPMGEDNQLRIELRGQILDVYANGQRLDEIQWHGLEARPVSVGLQACMAAPDVPLASDVIPNAAPRSGSSAALTNIEVSFGGFKLYSSEGA